VFTEAWPSLSNDRSSLTIDASAYRVTRTDSDAWRRQAALNPPHTAIHPPGERRAPASPLALAAWRLLSNQLPGYLLYGCLSSNQAAVICHLISCHLINARPGICCITMRRLSFVCPFVHLLLLLDSSISSFFIRPSPPPPFVHLFLLHSSISTSSIRPSPPLPFLDSLPLHVSVDLHLLRSFGPPPPPPARTQGHRCI
jgi:hypothetical protein